MACVVWQRWIWRNQQYRFAHGSCRLRTQIHASASVRLKNFVNQRVTGLELLLQRAASSVFFPIAIMTDFSADQALQYPIELDVEAVKALIPHRSPMLFIEQATVHAADRFTGVASWPADNPILAGHFPGCPIVPGAIILEAAAQLAGVGLLAGDPITRNIGSGHVGMLGAVRKCSFKRPVLPGDKLQFSMTCRRMAEKAVLAQCTGEVDGIEAAVLEFMVVYAPEGSLQEFIPPEALTHLFRSLPGSTR